MSMRTAVGPAVQAEVSPAWATEPRQPRAFRSRRKELALSSFSPATLLILPETLWTRCPRLPLLENACQIYGRGRNGY